MKVGDLVKCLNDENAIWGTGLVVAEETRMAKVLWNEPRHLSVDDYFISSTPKAIIESDLKEDEWLWKTSLEIISEASITRKKE